MSGLSECLTKDALTVAKNEIEGDETEVDDGRDQVPDCTRKEKGAWITARSAGITLVEAPEHKDVSSS